MKDWEDNITHHNTFVTRLEKALHSARPVSKVSVDPRDLRDLLHHFNRLDHEARAVYQHEQERAEQPVEWADADRLCVEMIKRIAIKSEEMLSIRGRSDGFAKGDKETFSRLLATYAYDQLRPHLVATKRESVEDENLLLHNMVCRMQRNPDFDFDAALAEEKALSKK